MNSCQVCHEVPMSSQKVILTIEKLASDGRGVARYHGKIVFVDWAVPGDEVEAQIEKDHKDYAEARLLKILKPSEDRTKPLCPYFYECGGCDLQHIKYVAQLKFKEQIVHDAISRLGHLQDIEVKPIIPSPQEWHYRNRIQLHKNSEGQIGFFKPKSHQIVEIQECLIAKEELGKKIGDTRRTPTLFGDKASLEIRTDDVARDGAFVQINAAQNEILKKLVIEFLEPQKPESIFDLFCGSGNFTFEIAKYAKAVLGVEKSVEAIQEAERLSLKNGITNITWKWAAILRGLMELKNQGKTCDAMVVDPPRRGLAEALEGIVNFKPKKIVYVSCNPATFAKDVAMFIKSGYHLQLVQPLDMFPQTSHVELVAQILF